MMLYANHQLGGGPHLGTLVQSLRVQEIEEGRERRLWRTAHQIQFSKSFTRLQVDLPF